MKKRKTPPGHYIDVADAIFHFQYATKESERELASSLKLSKSQVHRYLTLATLPLELKNAAKNYDIEMYVLLEWKEINSLAVRSVMANIIRAGLIRRRFEFKKRLAELIKEQKEIKNRTFPGTTTGRYSVRKHN